LSRSPEHAADQRFLLARWQGEDVACHGAVGFGRQRRWVADGHLGAPPADLSSSASRGGSRLVSGGLAAVDGRDLAVIPAFTGTPRRAYSMASERATSPPLGPWSAPLRSDDRRDRGCSNASRTGAVSAASGIEHQFPAALAARAGPPGSGRKDANSKHWAVGSIMNRAVLKCDGGAGAQRGQELRRRHEFRTGA
jgi:hypothetical protein